MRETRGFDACPMRLALGIGGAFGIGGGALPGVDGGAAADMLRPPEAGDAGG